MTISYEMMLMLMPDLGEQGTEKALDEVRELLNSLGGEITMEDVWGVRDLAYSIKKQDQAYYVVFNFTADPGKLSEIEANFNINQAVMRHLVIKTSNSYEYKSLEAYAEEEAKRVEQEEKENPKPAAKKPAAKPAAKKAAPKKEAKEAVEEKAEEAAESTEAPAKKETEKESKKKMEEVDEKLKSIIDDPDISL